MIFTLSSTISIKRKLLYFGFMVLIASVLLVSMVDASDPKRVELLKWIMPGLVAGISIVLLVIVQSNTRSAYERWGGLVPILMCLFIPLVITIILYLIGILFSMEDFGERFLLENIGNIMLINIPIIAAFYLLLSKANIKRG